MDEDLLKPYFTGKQFAAMSEYEKKRHLNMKQNYEMMIKIGLEVSKPVFMKGPFHPKKRKVIDSDDSDEDWKPGVDAVTVKRKKISSRFSAPFRVYGQTSKNQNIKRNQLAETESASNSGNGGNIQSDDCRSAGKSRKAKGGGVASNRYPKRSEIKPMVCYKESEIPDDDNFIYCEDCCELNEGQCPLHPLIKVKDKPTSKTCNDRARLSLPDGLQIRPSKIRKAGLGVWTKTSFPKGVQFGPYEGEVVFGDEGYSGYAWQIYKEGKRSHFIDGQKENKSNWMRFVNCARNEHEQNLVAFQYHNQIYYRTFKPILAHCELLVFYGQEYAQELKITDFYSGVLLKNTKKKGGCKMAFEEQKSENQIINDVSKQQLCYKSKTFVPNQTEQNNFCATSKRRINVQTENQKNTVPTSHKPSEDNSIDEYSNRKLNISSNSKKDLKIHTTGGKTYDCKHCGNKFTQSFNLQRHLKIHTDEKQYECGHCGKEFIEGGHLKRHIRIHTGQTPYECQHCGKKFKQSADLKIHIRMHTGETPYECEHCGNRFSDNSNLKAHVRIHTGETPYECEHCGRKFNHSGSLKRHLRIHTGETPYECEHCGRKFNHSGSLKTHLRIHTGETPYECEHCGRKFKQSGHLKKHLRIHTGEKPYECEHCERKFKQSGDLKTHIRIHAGQTPYECEHCGRKFKQSGHLKKHLRIHTGETPYECEHCGTKFKQSGDLKRHIRIHTGEKPYECQHCGKKFRNNSSFKWHLKKCTNSKKDIARYMIEKEE
ncbi:zinc finger protein 3-like [Anneissia japonica]|uniref:zinc finger protein 3-like n=1 Tax=Anneissia japonica TaxID=1529436 RepID=UPI0014256AC5|nr:zinc finger protein 3-like [Anneissia japonica]